VLLTASSAALASRLADDDSRPLLIGADKTATLERLSALRQPAYEAAAHFEVETEHRSVDDVAAAVVEEYRSWNG
jgi:shikimate kinase